MSEFLPHEFSRDFADTVIPADGQSPATHRGGVYPLFMTEDFYDADRSAELGRPYFRTKYKVRFLIPGDRTAAPERYVQEQDKIRFAREWEAFESAGEIAENGTPLEQWALLTRDRIASLKYLNIFTVEQLAEVDEANFANIGMGARELRDQAKAYLETSKTGAVPAKLVADNERMRGELELMREQLNNLSAMYEAKAKAAGDDVTEMKAPVVTRPETPVYEIPDGWENMKLKDLRDICANISAEPVLTRQNAVSVIEKYLETT